MCKTVCKVVYNCVYLQKCCKVLYNCVFISKILDEVYLFLQSVRGCIVDGNLAVLAMSIVKKGEADIPGLTDSTVPRRYHPLKLKTL